jgi:hypothetical protein
MRNLKNFTKTPDFQAFLDDRNLVMVDNVYDDTTNFPSKIPYTIENNEIKINLSDDSAPLDERPSIAITIVKSKEVNKNLEEFYKKKIQELFNNYNDKN